MFLRCAIYKHILAFRYLFLDMWAVKRDLKHLKRDICIRKELNVVYFSELIVLVDDRFTIYYEDPAAV